MSTKACELPRLWRKKALNLLHMTGIAVLVLYLRLYFCQQKLIRFQKKDMAKIIWVGSVALVVAK